MTRPGFALVVTVLLFVVLAALGASMLVVGSREGVIAARLVEVTRAQQAAEGEVRRAVAGWSTRERSEIPVHGILRLPGSGEAADLAVQRLDSGLFLVRADVRVGSGRGAVAARAAALIRTLDPQPLLAAFPAAINVTDGAALESGTVEVATGCGFDDGTGLLGPLLSWDAGVRLDGGTPGSTLLPPLPRTNPLAPPLLDALVYAQAGPGDAAPRPETAGAECRAGPGNWGSVLPTHPCYGLLPIVRGRGPLRLSGGEARGVLVMTGALTLDGTVRFHGLILTDDSVDIGAGAVVRGAIRARSLTLSGGTVVLDPCERAAAASAPALDGAFRPPSRWWIPAF